MNFLPALHAWQWGLLGLIPIGIILLYFLKLRRQPIEVPSTFLWTRTIEDMHVNSLLQRLRRNLLLFLQLLFIALAALALLRPGWQASSQSGRRMVLLLDASASMQSTDVKPSRFEQAKELLAQQIDNMDGSDSAMLIAFSDEPDVLQGFTSDRRRLRDALDLAQPTNRTTNMLDSLKAAAGLANPNRTSQAADVNDIQVADALPATLYIYSDGRVGAINDFDLGNLTPKFIPIGSGSANNMAITAFSAERNPEDPSQVQAFATIANLGSQPQSVTATLTRDGEFLDASAVELDPGEEEGLSFALQIDDDAGLKLSLDQTDDLAIDNVAYTGLSPLHSVAVLVVTPGNEPLKTAMQTPRASRLGRLEFVEPSYLESAEYKKRAADGSDDLIVYDRCAPETMPLASTWFIGSLPPKDWEAGDLSSAVFVVDVDRTHPIMRFLELFAIKIVEGKTLTGPAGTQTLMTSDSGPILALASRRGYQDLVLGFEIASESEDGGEAYNTDWPIQRSWPVFVYNVLRYLGGAIDTTGAPSYRPGQPITLRTENRLTEVELRLPSGETETLTAGVGGQTGFSDTEAVGLYQLFAGDRLLQMFTVNLFDAQESKIPATETIELGYETAETIAGEQNRRSEAWRWILLAALLLLVLEWITYSRRVWVSPARG
ncbi:vWA domain-containing protein [Rosistilla oblonga]|uniref:vWA domain-containing protein n=1 Tax=Rosistilla oblonga TaxID=2527990 RepID=UPI003A981136